MALVRPISDYLRLIIDSAANLSESESKSESNFGFNCANISYIHSKNLEKKKFWIPTCISFGKSSCR